MIHPYGIMGTPFHHGHAEGLWLVRVFAWNKVFEYYHQRQESVLH